ncbi:MAG: carbonic anhydrase [Rhodobacteraceae bacterium]|nr:carbonic anhydrase [Alphaproteobacteria bacterium]NNF71576.1 carbonic anhydrase [Paracoccaceae bacterium]NNK65297.1 carbonic anhydrase [Paracoccaceae bacterium]
MPDRAEPLPEHLIERYRDWHATIHEPHRADFEKLAREGQHPREMVISCCDSRVHVTSIFEARSGELFIHRNIAGLVPPYRPDGDHHGTSAAIEFAVKALNISHIIVLGHSGCAGVRGCYDMCSGHAPDLEDPKSFLGRWMEILRPGFERLPPGLSDDERAAILEKEAVLVSLENLAAFPFVAAARDRGDLTLHGAWNDIAAGTIEVYDPAKKAFAVL